MSCENCLNRRSFLTKTAVAAAALATGCGNGEFGPPLPSHSGPQGAVTIKVSDFPGLANTGVLVAVAPQRAAMRTGATTFVALSTVCTHQGCDADVVDNGTIVSCSCHGSRFDKNGNVLNGPAERPLPQLATVYNAQTDDLTIG